MCQVMWLVLTNLSALFHSFIDMLLVSSLITYLRKSHYGVLIRAWKHYLLMTYLARSTREWKKTGHSLGLSNSWFAGVQKHLTSVGDYASVPNVKIFHMDENFSQNLFFVRSYLWQKNRWEREREIKKDTLLDRYRSSEIVFAIVDWKRERDL